MMQAVRNLLLTLGCDYLEGACVCVFPVTITSLPQTNPLAECIAILWPTPSRGRRR